MLGVFGLEDAIQQAEDVGLDVVLISPDADPPVCRMMDASRHKYELDKKDKEAKKKQREARYKPDKSLGRLTKGAKRAKDGFSVMMKRFTNYSY